MSQNMIIFLLTVVHVGECRVLHSWWGIGHCSELDLVEMDTKGLSNFNKDKVIIAICQGQSRAATSEAQKRRQWGKTLQFL